MEELPIKLKKYFSQEGLDTSTTVSYWIESHKPEKGALGFFISISGSNGFSVERVAKFMWDSFRESYLDSKSDHTSNLKESMKDSQKRLMELIKNEEGISEVGLDIHMCGVVIVDEKIFLSKIGSPEILLFRENKITNVSKSLPGYEAEGYKNEIPVGSFDLRKSDIFILSTPKLAESVSELIEGEDVITWDLLNRNIETFSGGLVGTQYIWLIGFRIDDMPNAMLQDLDEIKTNVEEDKDVDVVVKGPEVIPKEVGEEIKIKKRFDIKDFVADLWVKLKDWVSSINLQSVKRNISAKITSLKVGGGPRKKMFVQKNSRLSFDSGDRKRKIIGISMITIIVVVIILVVRSQRNIAYNADIQNDIESIQSDIDEAKDIWKNDEMQASELLSQIDEAVKALEEKKLSNSQEEEVEGLKSGALAVNDEMNRITAIGDGDEFEILLETYLEIGESANVTDISYRDDYLYLVDSSTHGVYKYDISGGGIEAVADSKEVMKEPVLMTVGENIMFVYDNKEGMLSLDMEDPGSGFNTMPELSARTIEDVIDIETFGDNIYILKSDEARVLKSYPAGLGYSYPEEYFRHGAFDKATDLMIDGNIYVLSNGSDKVYKFYGGTQDQFTITGLDKDLGNVRCGFSNLSDSRPLYLYDKENERIVVIEKGTGEKHPGQGVMIKQYLYRGSRDDIFKDVIEIVVDGNEKNMYLLDGTKVLRITL